MNNLTVENANVIIKGIWSLKRLYRELTCRHPFRAIKRIVHKLRFRDSEQVFKLVEFDASRDYFDLLICPKNKMHFFNGLTFY